MDIRAERLIASATIMRYDNMIFYKRKGSDYTVVTSHASKRRAVGLKWKHPGKLHFEVLYSGLRLDRTTLLSMRSSTSFVWNYFGFKKEMFQSIGHCAGPALLPCQSHKATLPTYVIMKNNPTNTCVIVPWLKCQPPVCQVS